MRLCGVQGVTHILISETQRGLKRQSLCFNTTRNLGWALRESIKQQISLQLPFYEPHLFRFLFKSTLYAEHIQYTEEGFFFEGDFFEGGMTRTMTRGQ